jgi:hypothetical protein
MLSGQSRTIPCLPSQEIRVVSPRAFQTGEVLRAVALIPLLLVRNFEISAVAERWSRKYPHLIRPRFLRELFRSEWLRQESDLAIDILEQ